MRLLDFYRKNIALMLLRTNQNTRLCENYNLMKLFQDENTEMELHI